MVTPRITEQHTSASSSRDVQAHDVLPGQLQVMSAQELQNQRPVLPSSTSMSSSASPNNQQLQVRDPFKNLLPHLLHAEGVPIRLPCMMQLEFDNPLYGRHQVWAILYWVDAVEPTGERVTKTGSSQSERYAYTNEGKTNAERRCLYLHQIVHVMPLGSPFGHHVGKRFSSLNESARLFGHGVDALHVWHLMFQPVLSLARVIATTGFQNPDIRAAVDSIVHGQCSMRSRIIKKKELLSAQVGHRDEPLLAMDLIRNQSAKGDDEESDEEPEGQEAALEHLQRTHHVPGWVPSDHTLTRYQRLAFEGRFRNITFRDCFAAMCEFECNDLECDVPEEVEMHALASKKCPTYTCSHGITHSPYIACEEVGHDDPHFVAKYSGDQHSAEALFLTPKHLALRSRNKQGKMEKIPKRGTLLPRSAFENRIVFDYLGSNHQVTEIRRHAPKLLEWITMCLHDAHSAAFTEMVSCIEEARTIMTAEALARVDRFHDIWEVQRTTLYGTAPLARIGGVPVVPVTWNHKFTDYVLPGMLRSHKQTRPITLHLNVTTSAHAILREWHANQELRPLQLQVL